MQPDFWHQKWAANQIGFHERETHPMLLAHWHKLGLGAAKRVFVPLCGKSNDMLWLHQQGLEVVGIELSDIAVQAFFADNAMRARCDKAGALSRYSAQGFVLYSGDFFDLTPSELDAVDAIYDRAALIALPDPMRTTYAHHLDALASPGTRMFLITVAYDEAAVSPPPFVVSHDEVAALYNSNWQVTRLANAETTVKGQPANEAVFQLLKDPTDAG